MRHSLSSIPFHSRREEVGRLGSSASVVRSFGRSGLAQQPLERRVKFSAPHLELGIGTKGYGQGCARDFVKVRNRINISQDILERHKLRAAKESSSPLPAGQFSKMRRAIKDPAVWHMNGSLERRIGCAKTWKAARARAKCTVRSLQIELHACSLCNLIRS